MSQIENLRAAARLAPESGIVAVVNHGRTKPYEHGDGYGHLAVAVDDLAAEHARLANEGVRTQPNQRNDARRSADGALLLRAGPGRL